MTQLCCCWAPCWDERTEKWHFSKVSFYSQKNYMWKMWKAQLLFCTRARWWLIEIQGSRRTFALHFIHSRHDCRLWLNRLCDTYLFTNPFFHCLFLSFQIIRSLIFFFCHHLAVLLCNHGYIKNPTKKNNNTGLSV